MLTVGPKQACVDEHLGLFRGFDMRSHNAGDAAIEKRIDVRAADIRHPCGHGEPKAIGDAAHLVNRLRREQPVFAVQVDKIEAAEHADDLDGLGTWINQAKTETLLALLVFLKYLVRSNTNYELKCVIAPVNVSGFDRDRTKMAELFMQFL